MGAREDAEMAGATGNAEGETEAEDASTSPADRFADALDQDEEAATQAETPADEPVDEPATAASTASAGWSWEQQAADESDVVAESATIAVDRGEAVAASPDAWEDALPSVAASTGESPRQRAASLLDELRGLLPQIAAGDAVADASDTGSASAVADRLAAARDESGDFASLRRTLESAKQNPRDVDTMLDLVNRADRLLALLDGYERLTGEIDDAITQLRNG
jgi:hypothetical protein